MSRQFDKLGLPFERIPAIDSRSLAPAAWKQHATNRFDGHEWGSSEIGCFLSHRQCWRSIAEGPDAYGAVFEDDVELDPEVRPLLLTDAWIPAGADIVKLEASTMESYQGARQNIRVKHRFYRSALPWEGAAAYVISKELATRIAAIDVFDCVVDQFLFDSNRDGHDFRSLEVRPGICLQTRHKPDRLLELESTIALDRVVLERPVPKIKRSVAIRALRELMRPFRRTKARLVRMYRTWKATPLDIPHQP